MTGQSLPAPFAPLNRTHVSWQALDGPETGMICQSTFRICFAFGGGDGGGKNNQKTLRYEGALIFKKVNLFIEILTEMYGQAGVPGISSRGEELTQAAFLRQRRRRP